MIDQQRQMLIVDWVDDKCSRQQPLRKSSTIALQDQLEKFLNSKAGQIEAPRQYISVGFLKETSSFLSFSLSRLTLTTRHRVATPPDKTTQNRAEIALSHTSVLAIDYS
jgi:hypothetical protein